MRNEGLEVEERASISLAQQDYDQMRMLSGLAPDSNLYGYKLDQFKGNSTSRSEIDKVYQEQRLEKVRHDYEKAKWNDRQHFDYSEWKRKQEYDNFYSDPGNKVDYSQRYPGQVNPEAASFVNVPMSGGYQKLPFNDQHQNFVGQMNASKAPLPDHIVQSMKRATIEPVNNVPYMVTNDPDQGPQKNIQANGLPPGQVHYKDLNFKPKPQKVKTYKPKKGFEIHFDFISQVERKYKEVRVVYGIYQASQPIVENRILGVYQAEPDRTDDVRNRINIRECHLLKKVPPHAGANLILEV